MIIALASPRVASSVEKCLDKIKRLLSEAAARARRSLASRKTYLPEPADLTSKFRPSIGRSRNGRSRPSRSGRGRTRSPRFSEWNGAHGRGPADRGSCFWTPRQDAGCQTRTGRPDRIHVPGNTRQLFEINGLKFGIAICHEGFRYPETVRWAAVRGAKVVFHPHCTGSDKTGVALSQWGATDSPYFEKAMAMRSRENTIYFASVNYAFRYRNRRCLSRHRASALLRCLMVRKACWCVNRRECRNGFARVGYAPERYRDSMSE